MTPARIGTIGERLDLLIRQGATLGPFVCSMSNPDGTPVDLTGVLITGQIRKTPASPQVAAQLEVRVTNPVAGQYEFGLSAITSAALTAGADISRPESAYVWDLELHDTLGRVIPLYYGEARVHREVTRAEG